MQPRNVLTYFPSVSDKEKNLLTLTQVVAIKLCLHWKSMCDNASDSDPKQFLPWPPWAVQKTKSYIGDHLHWHWQWQRHTTITLCSITVLSLATLGSATHIGLFVFLVVLPNVAKESTVALHKVFVVCCCHCQCQCKWSLIKLFVFATNEF